MAIDKVVDLKAFRARIQVQPKSCDHRHIIIDPAAGFIECCDCHRTLSAFVVLLGLSERWAEVTGDVHRLKARASAMRSMLSRYKVRLRALKALEKFWWRGSLLPACPHCHRGLMAADFAAHAGVVSLEFERRQREREKK